MTSIGANHFCFNSVTHTFQVVPAFGPVSVTGPTAAICLGSNTTLTASATGAVNYTWTPGPIVGDPVSVMPTANTVYTVISSNMYGCTASSTYEVDVQNCCINPGTGNINFNNLRWLNIKPLVAPCIGQALLQEELMQI